MYFILKIPKTATQLNEDLKALQDIKDVLIIR